MLHLRSIAVTWLDRVSSLVHEGMYNPDRIDVGLNVLRKRALFDGLDIRRRNKYSFNSGIFELTGGSHAQVIASVRLQSIRLCCRRSDPNQVLFTSMNVPRISLWPQSLTSVLA